MPSHSHSSRYAAESPVFGIGTFIAIALVVAVAASASGGSDASSNANNSTDSSASVTTSNSFGSTSSTNGEAQTSNEDLRISFIDVGQGSSTLVIFPDKTTMLVDAGPDADAQKVKEELANEGVTKKIDYIIASSSDADHICGLESIVNDYEIGELLTPETNDAADSISALVATAKSKKIATTSASAENKIVDNNDFSATVLVQKGNNVSGTASSSLVALLIQRGEKKFLVSGDMSATDLKELKVGDIDVLSVPQHGLDTGTTSELTGELKPEYAVISFAQSNEIGCPQQGALDALADAKVYGTAVNGTVRVRCKDNKISVVESSTGSVISTDAYAKQQEEAKAKAEEEERAKAEAEAQKKAQEEAEAQRKAEEEEAARQRAQEEAQQKQQARQNKTVYITKSGSKYHLGGCRTTKRSKNLTELTLGEAEARGYEACQVCNP